MTIIFDSVLIDIVAILVAGLIGLITYFKWAFKYWEKKNVPYLEPSFPFGTSINPLGNRISIREHNKKQYDKCKAKRYKHAGLFVLSYPLYMPIDPDYVKNIMTRGFDHFVDRGMYYNEKDDPLSAHLFSIEGAKWRNLRTKLTPTFTSGKMKMMFQTLIECAEQLKLFMKQIENEPINIKDVLGRFTTDVIGSCAFGLNCNSFEDPNSEFSKRLKRVFISTKFEALKSLFAFSAPTLSRWLGIKIIPKESSDFIMKVVKDTVEFREKNNFERNDFLQLLLNLKNNVTNGGEEYQHVGEEYQHVGKSLTINELAAQAFIFLFAGYETSSTTMTFCLFELSLNLEIQQKVRDEIHSVLEKHDGNITYDAIMEMKYLGQVIDETLRKYPPLSILSRKCVADYKIPDTNVVIDKGTVVIIPVIGLQHDEEYFPNSDKFDPERFSEKNKNKINPFTYMPFGEGPRNCIGLRFGIMQTKIGLAILLKNYIFSLNNKTEVPLQFDPASFITATLGNIWLNVKSV